MPARLDDIDRHILKELQDDGRITNVELARRVGISAPPCLRRVRALEEAGFIKGYRALLDEKKLGYEVAVFAMVHLASQAEADLTAFEDFVRGQPLVRECWMLSGEIDFVLKCVAPDLKTFQAFVEKLTAAPQVRNVKTSLVLRNSKDAAMVPMEMRGVVITGSHRQSPAASRRRAVSELNHIVGAMAPWLHAYGSAAVFVILLFESLGLPLPGESLLIVAAILAGRGDISFPVLLLSAWGGAVAGDNIGY